MSSVCARDPVLRNESQKAAAKMKSIRPVADHVWQGDDDLMQALITVGAFLSLADGEVQKVERDALLNFLDQLHVAPRLWDLGEVFERRVHQLILGDDMQKLKIIVSALRPVAGLSLSSLVVPTAERVAAADRHMHSGELKGIELIRFIMKNLPDPFHGATARAN